MCGAHHPLIDAVSEATILEACGERELPRIGVIEQDGEIDSIPETEIETPAACEVSPLIGGTIRKPSAMNSATTVFARRSNIASSPRSITLITLAWTVIGTINAR